MSPAISIPQSLKTIHIALLAIAFALLGFLFIVYVAFAHNLITFPFDYDQGEGFELVDSIMLSQGNFPYQNTDSYPFYSSNYPPVFHLFPIPFIWAFGNAYWYARLISFVGTLITASIIAYAVYKQPEQNKWIAILSGLAFLASNTVYHIGPLVRQHITMVLFETLAIVILAYAFPNKKRGQIALGLAMLILAGYTKQLAAFTAIAALVWMFLQNPRRAVLWGIGFAFVGGLIFAGLYFATDGEWWRQTIVANVNQFNYDQAIGLFKLWFQLHGFLIIPALFLIVHDLYFGEISIYSVWFIVVTLLGGIGSGAWGAGDSYFATSIASLCILSGFFFSRTLAQSWTFDNNYLSRSFIFPLFRFKKAFIYAAFIMVPLLYIAYARAVWHQPTSEPVFSTVAQLMGIEANVQNGFYDSASYQVGGYAHIGHFVTDADIEAGYQIVDLILASDKPVLTEDASFNIVAGKEVITNPTQLLNLWKAGLYNGDELIQMLEDQAFAYLVLRAQFYPPEVLQAMAAYYETDQTILMNGFEYIIMKPRNGQP